MAEHPFPDGLVAAIAEEHDVDRAELASVLAGVQRRFERGEDEYEYSSQHNFGWSDDELFYLYGSERVWETIREERESADALVDATRAVHERAMVQSAAERGDEETVREMFSDGNEPLAVANRGDGPPRFGQDV